MLQVDWDCAGKAEGAGIWRVRNRVISSVLRIWIGLGPPGGCPPARPKRVFSPEAPGTKTDEISPRPRRPARRRTSTDSPSPELAVNWKQRLTQAHWPRKRLMAGVRWPASTY